MRNKKLNKRERKIIDEVKDIINKRMQEIAKELDRLDNELES